MRRLRHDERGMSLILVVPCFLAFMIVSILAIDVGMILTARTQAQNAADAGALAGATALALNSFTDQTPSGPAVKSALIAARTNGIMGQPPSVLAGDVTFLSDPSGQTDRVQVTVQRSSTRGNPVPTLVASLIGAPTANVAATAVGEAAPANAETCVKPWTIPDKWTELSKPPNGQFDLGVDQYVPVDQPGYTGYNVDRDAGTEVLLKPNNANKTAPSFYNEWAIPPGRGGSWYRDNIENCNAYVQPIGDLMTAEPGNKVGPTDQGTTALIDRDPGAYWDTSCTCVKGSAFGSSPRIVIIPAYDPFYYESGKQNGRNASLKVANWIGVFVESIANGNVTGRITAVPGLLVGSAGTPPEGAFPRVIRLVQ